MENSKTTTYLTVHGMDEYQLDVITLFYSVGGKSTLYKLYINGVRCMDFPSKRLDKETKAFFGIEVK